jgi:hypothetical protein
MKISKRLKAFAATSLVAVSASVALSAPAHAEGATNCTWGDGSLCLHYNSNQGGAYVGVRGDAYDYAKDYSGDNCIQGQPCPSYRFSYGGSGLGANLKNNAASVFNTTPATCMFYVYYNSGYTGSRDGGFLDGRFNLTVTYNNNASQHNW